MNLYNLIKISSICYLFFLNFTTHTLASKNTGIKLNKLDSLQKSKSYITISGLSSGGYFANQFHIAHSSIINGTAIFTAGPYYCAKSSIEMAKSICMKGLNNGPKTYELIELTNDWSKLSYIDNTNNLINDIVYLYHGSLDSIINPIVSESLQSYYNAFVKLNNIAVNYNFPSEHCIPTLSYGSSCEILSSPYIGNCNYDGAGNALNFLYKNKLFNNSLIKSNQITTNLHKFDQTIFIPQLKPNHFLSAMNSISNFGYIYIPTNCENNFFSESKNSMSNNIVCDLHISFHGCLQNLELISNDYAINSGFNNYAEKNNIVILYPYVKQSSDPYNPDGCWDWWGYTGPDYVLKSGYQIQFIKNIIDQLFGFV